MKINEFHYRALAAAGDRDAYNILKGIDLVGWANIDPATPRSRVETDFMREDADTTNEMQRLGWTVMRSTMRGGEAYYQYHVPRRLVT